MWEGMGGKGDANSTEDLRTSLQELQIANRRGRTRRKPQKNGIEIREFLKALEMATAMKRSEISCSFGSDC